MTEPAMTVQPMPAAAGLSREALVKYDAALARTPWAIGHRRRSSLITAGEELASADCYALVGALDGQPMTICGIGGIRSGASADGQSREDALIRQILDEATRERADIALLFRSVDSSLPPPEGFAAVPITEFELRVTESSRYGAPMTLVRGGEERDLAAIAAMGQIRAERFGFHLDRDVDFIKYSITRRRLLAGLGPPGVREVTFVIAEEGITAAAYMVISVTTGSWSIEECGDRDPSGARVGALLQALIALEPSRSRPTIRAWLPPGFLPPQVTIASASPAPPRLWTRPLSPRAERLHLSADDLLYWRNDVF